MFALSSLWICIDSFLLTGNGYLYLPNQAQITLKRIGIHSLFAVDICIRLFTEKDLTFTE